MLEKGRARKPAGLTDCTIIDPVYIEDSVTLTGSTVGPNVSICEGSVLTNSTVRDSIIERNAKIDNCTLTGSLVGSNTVISGMKGTVSMGDYSEAKGGG
jgi:glucose-1-phosphate thymidylyltransferase